MNSMTGYGMARFENENIKIMVEAKSVNHRFLECSIRLPHSFLYLEESIRKEVQQTLSRGKIDIFIKIEGEGLTSRRLEVDVGLLEQYVNKAEEIESIIGKTSALDMNALLFNDQIVQVVEEESEQTQVAKRMVMQAMKDCLTRLSEMRKAEGVYILTNFNHWLEEMSEFIKKIERIAPTMTLLYQERLEKRMRAILEKDVDLDEERVLTEVAVFAERIDISEEIVRLHSHIDHFRQICQQEQGIGRKLDFLVQEMNREANTIGSKANHTEIRRYVVELKSFIEKLKEQVQNVE
ncbi:YicC/YloC family endoribonuclease [Bacillus solitudinis]|uniref:YicC/YloC family endoribonuclease n=1 Tax=Bacillus solitudinis TaxID=2014074 RepID=UPI000C234831|nr:YicC/YloC family endoribonuclease [Bacillus solitudinis]